MKPWVGIVVLFLCDLFFSGALVHSLSYDYSASIECMIEPPKSQYGGGVLQNPEFFNDLKGWSSFGYASIAENISENGNRYSVAHSRNMPYQSISQKVYLHKQKLYTFSAWVQVSHGRAPVTVIFKMASNFTHAGSVIAKDGCWSMLKGGLTVENSGPAEFYFESDNIEVDIWIDSVSLQPFSKRQWAAHQSEQINNVRKKKLKFQAVDGDGKALAGAKISIKQTRPGFPFGSAVNKNILNNAMYQNWFLPRFTATAFENELKWYDTEATPGNVNYNVSDALFDLMKRHYIDVRGHNILWDDPLYQPYWVKSLASEKLRDAANNRTHSVINHYKGQLIAWDVVNENIHHDFFEQMLGANASGVYYAMAHELDPDTPLFLNDYNTLAYPGDPVSTPSNYLEKLQQMQKATADSAPMGIGLEGHFIQPNIPYIRSALDTLAGAKVPIWLTEVDVGQGQNQAIYLEEILREVYSHPAVKGIVMWAAWSPQGCYRMCLTDNNFNNLPTGDVVDKLIKEWKTKPLQLTTHNNGSSSQVELYHGQYTITVQHSSMYSTYSHEVTIDAGSSDHITFEVKG